MISGNLNVDALGRASRRAAVLSLAGVIVVLTSLAYSYHTLTSLQAKRDALKNEVDTLQPKVEALLKQYEHLKGDVGGLKYATVTPENHVFQVVASAKGLPGVKTSDGSQLYRFSIYVNGSLDLLSQISKVAYDLHHPTIGVPHREEADPSDNFATHYVGWGCLQWVDVTIHMKDGTSQVIPFDMCKSLGDGWVED